MFVNVAAEHIVEFGQSQASVWLWWNVNISNNDRWNLAGQIEWAADYGEDVPDEASRNATKWRYSWGHTISCWSWSTLHRLWFYRPRLFCLSVKQLSDFYQQKADAGCTSRAFKHPGHDVTRTWRLAVNLDWLHIWFRAGHRWWHSPKCLDAASRSLGEPWLHT